ncbi:MAG: polymerase subunit gamma/tau [Gammaproteobacteria bacterium]|jgi:DNA polymerase-3 subunit gamma/tau|nr:polymerase subunit gamma/tau [Gammaproteobacteria bacterium]
MPNHVLARKWRPQSFTEVIGQAAIVQALTHALESGRLHHAYLFSGTRGIGKTSLARLLAKCLSCEKGPTATPCGQCHPCLTIAQGNYLDLLEIDAASRTKVEDTRELLESVQYPPIMGRYKIILIDEVHMLSGHSFNALLKTLEEPPKHVIFLLATTEPEKLPNTVLSRCLHFTLKPLTNDVLSEHFNHILQREHIRFDPNALTLIAKAACGSVRDGLSLLERCIAFCGSDITVAKISELLGLADSHTVQQLLDTLIKNDAVSGLTLIRALAEKGADFSGVLEAFIELLHQLALQQVLQKDNPTLLSAERIQLYYQIALIGRRDLPLAPDPQMGFEMLYIRLLSFQPWHEENEVLPVVKKKLSIPAMNPI